MIRLTIITLFMFLMLGCTKKPEPPNASQLEESNKAESDSRKQYYENGTIQSESQLKNGRRHGTHTYWRADGSKYVSGEFIEGIKHGPWTRWHTNGKKESQGQHKNGTKYGTWHYFGLEEEKLRDEEYSLGLRNGTQTVWYTNGQKRHEGKYVDNDKQGLWTSWDQNGQVTKVMQCKDGECVQAE
jgi:antitoxin component YwqK of YwqJK toxin-antitoxin module